MMKKSTGKKVAKKRGEWYEKSVFNLHLDHHAYETSPIGADADPKKIKRLLELVRPGMVQYDSKSHAGYASYPTKIGHPAKGLKKDIIRIYRDVTRELEIPFSIYHCGLWDELLAKLHPEWVRQAPDGQPQQVSKTNNCSMCTNTSFLDKHLLPILRELTEWYDPDGFWLDGDVWSVVPCYCPACRRMFRDLTGLEAPIDKADPNWPLWAKFHRDSYVDYLRRRAEAIWEISPDCLLCSNYAYALLQPDEVCDYVDWFSQDTATSFAPRHISIEARFLQWQGRPFEIMTWNMGPGFSPGSPPRYKSTEHLLQEGALTLANGGRWSVWDSPTWADDLYEPAYRTLRELGRFARARRRLVLNTTSVPWVAVLYGQTAHYAQDHTYSFENGGPVWDALHGLGAMLDEEGIHFDILNEERFCERLPLYRVAILAGQAPLAPEVVEAVREYVRNGGRLLVIGKTAMERKGKSRERFVLGDVLGVKFVKPLGPCCLGEPAEKIIKGFYGVIPAGPECQMVKPTSARSLVAFWDNPQEARTRNPGVPLTELQGMTVTELAAPALTENRFGKGRCYFVPADLGGFYQAQGYPPVRAWLGQLVRKIAPPIVDLGGEKHIEVTVREAPGRLIVNLVNLLPGKELRGNASFVEQVPRRGPVPVQIECPVRPAAVTLEPGKQEIKWSWAKGQLKVTVPELHIHVAVVAHFPRD